MFPCCTEEKEEEENVTKIHTFKLIYLLPKLQSFPKPSQRLNNNQTESLAHTDVNNYLKDHKHLFFS